MPAHRGYYPLLVSHIFLGSLVLLAACLQVWPWLRRSHPAVHRWSGRVYVVAALAASLCVMIIAPMGLHGPNQQVANLLIVEWWLHRRRPSRRDRPIIVRPPDGEISSQRSAAH